MSHHHMLIIVKRKISNFQELFFKNQNQMGRYFFLQKLTSFTRLIAVLYTSYKLNPDSCICFYLLLAEVPGVARGEKNLIFERKK